MDKVWKLGDSFSIEGIIADEESDPKIGRFVQFEGNDKKYYVPKESMDYATLFDSESITTDSHDSKFSISLRDHFAILAVGGYLASIPERSKLPPVDRVAIYCYELADAMLKVRSSK